MLIGSADQLAAPVEKMTFVEELPEHEQLGLIANLPPGLTNISNTCYMNSVVQALNSIPELSLSLNKFTGSESSPDPSISIMASLKKLLNDLQSKHTTITPAPFLLNLHKQFPQFAEMKDNILMQQDAEECWTQLVHSTKKLDGVMSQSAFETLFEGKMKNTYKCLESEEEEETNTEDSFSKLSCHINNEIDYLFQGVNLSINEVIEKHSPVLNKLAQFQKNSKVSELPYYLTVQFVRFFWRKDIGQKVKILRPVDFPLELDAYEFCTDELRKKLVPNREKILKNDTLPQPEKMPIEQAEYKNETGFYELCAVISHKDRDAESGHYVAWVKEKDDEWILFDDHKVSVVGNDQIKKLSGKGGADWHMAYICLYRTKKF